MPSKIRDIAEILGVTETANTTNAVLTSVADGSGLVVYATPNLLPTSGLTAGDQAYVTSNSRLYISNGSGWYNVALINSTPTFTSGPDAAYALATDLTPTVITLVAQDSDGQVVTYSATDSGMDGIATLSQDSSVFTITPLTDSAGGNTGTFTITFQATDGIGIANALSTFTLSFAANYVNKLDGTDYRMGQSAGGSFTTTTPFSRSGEYSFAVSGNGDIQRRPGYPALPTSLTFNDYTISLWFRINAWQPSSNNVYLFNSEDKLSAGNSFGSAANSVNTSTLFFVTGSYNGSTYGGLSVANTFGLNTWYHAVFTASTTGPTIGCWVTELGQTFANKVNATTFGGQSYLVARVAGLKIADTTGWYLHGSIGNVNDGGNVTYDDLRIYNAKATAADAEAIFNSDGLVEASTNPMQSNLKLAYKFDNTMLSI